MIADALQFITSQLDDFLKRKTSTKSTMVKLSGLPANNGKAPSIKENGLVISLVNMEIDGSMVNRSELSNNQGGLAKKSPPLLLNVYILLTSTFKGDHYAEGLHWLSLAMGFFHQHPVFSSIEFVMPSGVEKLTLELTNTEMDKMNGLWVAMGANYQPSVIYKVRMLKIDDENILGTIPEIKMPGVNP